MPRVTVSVRVRLGTVLDLADGKTRSALRVSGHRLLDAPWRQEQQAGREAFTQPLGRLVHELGWEGLLVPSAARRGGMNLIVYPRIYPGGAPWRSSTWVSCRAEMRRYANLHADL